MQRGGPRSTIPPPSQRPRAGPRWPLQVIVGACVVAAAFFGMRALRHEADTPPPARFSDKSVARPETPHTDMSDTRTVSPVAAPTIDVASFIRHLRQADTYRVLGDIEVAGDVRDLIAQEHVAEAANRLETLSRADNRDANVALARLARTCVAEDPDTRRSAESAHAEASRRAKDLSPETRQRLQASLALSQERRATLTNACKQARFDSRAIDQRLRGAAAAGHEASLWQLGNEVEGDLETRRKHWLSAAMLGYLPAQLDLAESLMQDALRGDRRERGRMNFWLETAAKQSPQGKALLAECLLDSCNAQPPDTATAASLLQEATLSGAAESLGTLASLSSDDPAAPTDERMYSLNAFLQRLNDLGCYGDDLYPGTALRTGEHLQQLALRLSPSGLQQAQRMADEDWRAHGAEARAAIHCD